MKRLSLTLTTTFALAACVPDEEPAATKPDSGVPVLAEAGGSSPGGDGGTYTGVGGSYDGQASEEDIQSVSGDCDAPAVEVLFAGDAILQGVALAGDTLVFGGIDGLFVVPKDGSAEPRRIFGAGVGDASLDELILDDKEDWIDFVGVVGSTIYFTTPYSSYSIPLEGGDAEEWSYDEDLVIDGDTIYGFSDDLTCAFDEPITVYAPTGTDEIYETCIQKVDAFSGVVVASSGDGENYSEFIRRFRAGEEPELLVTTGEDEYVADLELTEAYLYFTTGSGDDLFGENAFARLSLSDGKVEELGSSDFNTMLGLSDGIYAADFTSGCIRWFGDDGTVEEVAVTDTAQALAVDDAYVYGVTYEGAVFRTPR